AEGPADLGEQLVHDRRGRRPVPGRRAAGRGRGLTWAVGEARGRATRGNPVPRVRAPAASRRPRRGRPRARPRGGTRLPLETGAPAGEGTGLLGTGRPAQKTPCASYL